MAGIGKINPSLAGAAHAPSSSGVSTSKPLPSRASQARNAGDLPAAREGAPTAGAAGLAARMSVSDLSAKFGRLAQSAGTSTTAGLKPLAQGMATAAGALGRQLAQSAPTAESLTQRLGQLTHGATSAASMAASTASTTAATVAQLASNVLGAMQSVTGGSDPNAQDADGKTALRKAPDASQVGSLMRAGASLAVSDKEGVNPLMEAISQGKTDAVAAMLHPGNDAAGTAKDAINAQCKRGATPLGRAVLADNAELTGLLVQHGASLASKEGPMGMNPLMQAAFQGDKKALAAMFEHGDPAQVEEAVNARSNEGHSPLDFAVCKGDPEIIGLLAKHGASALSQDASGKSALVKVAALGNKAMLEALSHNDTTGTFKEALNAESGEGHKPLAYALRVNGDADLIAFMKNQGAHE